MAARVEPRRVDSLSLVSSDANQESVPTEYAQHPVTVVASVDEVHVVAGDRTAAACRGEKKLDFVELRTEHFATQLNDLEWRSDQVR